jgi:hypothetical protein
MLMKFEFSGQIFEKNHQISNYLKICTVGTELFCVDGRTDMMKLIATFQNCANTPKNIYFISEKFVTILPFGNWLLKVAWL